MKKSQRPAYKGGVSLRAKLFISFTLAIFVVSVVISGFFYWRSSAILKDKNNTLSDSLISQTVTSLNYLFAGIENTSRVFASDESLRQILRRSQESDYSFVQQLKDYQVLSGILGKGYWDENIHAVQLFCSGNAIYAREELNLFSLDAIRDRPWYEKVCFLQGGPFWYAENGTLSCALGIMDYFAQDDVSGVFKVDLRRAQIEENLQGFINFSKGEAALIDLEGAPVLVMGTQPGLITDYLAWDRGGDKKAVFRDEANRRQVQITGLANGWQLWVTVSDEIFFAGRLELLISVLLPFSLAVAAAMGTIHFTLRTQTKRIENLAAFLRTVKIDSDELLGQSGHDEIAVLQSGVNQLLNTTRSSIKNAALATRLKNQADYNILQEQINPHFLYNCLDSINWMAIECRVPEISKMARQLGRFYRLSLHGGNKAVPLYSEIEHTLVYTEIMQIRFDGEIDIHYRINPAAQALTVPKLLLQPLIENAIRHGISGRESAGGQIRVRADLADGLLTLRVTDNGVGINGDKLHKLRAALNAGDGSASYGMCNIHQRIQLTYGKDFGLSVYSYLGRGTAVVIRIPAEPQGRQ